MRLNWMHIVTAIIGGLLVMMYFKSCNPCPEIVEKKVEIKYLPGEVIREIDSTYFVKYNELLGMIPKETPKFRGKLPKRIQKQIEKQDTNNPCGLIRQFVTAVNDSNEHLVINGEIINLVRGEVLNTDFKYTTKSLVVKDISTKTDTIKIETTNNVIKNHFLVGVESSVKPILNHISISGDFLHKKGWGVGYRYEKSFIIDDSHNIRVTKTIF